MPSCITFNLWMVNIKLDLLLALLQFQQTVRMSCPHEFTCLTDLKQDGIPSQPTLEYELRESMCACRSLRQHENPPQALPYPSRGWRGGGLRCPPTVKDWGLTITSQYASLVHFLCFVVWYSTVAPPNYEKSTCNSWPVAGDRWCSWRHAGAYNAGC